MKLKRFLLRYYPPGIILEYELRDKSREMKEIDLLHLTANADVDVIVNQIVAEEPLISESKKPHLRKLLYSTCPRAPALSLPCRHHAAPSASQGRRLYGSEEPSPAHELCHLCFAEYHTLTC